MLYGLPWGWPGWIGNGTHNPYYNVTTTATYIIKWIHGAKKYHDLDINFVGVISGYHFFNTKTRVCLKKKTV